MDITLMYTPEEKKAFEEEQEAPGSAWFSSFVHRFRSGQL